MPIRLTCSLFMALVIFTAAAPAAASPVTLTFAGQFSGQTGLAPYNFSDATITGFYTYESTTPDTNADPDIGSYVDTLSQLGGTVTWSGGSFSFLFGATDGNITIWDNEFVGGATYHDLYEVRSGGGDGVFDNDLALYQLVAFNFNMRTITVAPANNITSTALLVPTLFDSPLISMTFQTDAGTQGGKLDFRVTQLNEVPEPATIALLGLGLTGLGTWLRRRA